MSPSGRHRLPLFLVPVFGSALFAGEIRFTKTQLDKEFRAEGVAVADVDGDGKKDIIAGPLWYKAPEWKPHEVTLVKPFKPLEGYSESFCCYSDDLSGDGHPDLIVVGFPGAPVRVYENPGPEKLNEHWKEYQAFPSCSNESPAYADIDGDGKREIVCGFEPEKKMGWFAPGAKIADPWTCHPFSGPKAPGADTFYHGLGVGDVNKDDRLDVVTPEGWYEAPADRKSPDWKFHQEPLAKPTHAHILVFDFDGDGDQDILMSSAHSKGIWWHEQERKEDGGRKWTEHAVDASFTQTHSLVLADMNKDGLPDFVTGKRWMAHMGKDPEEDADHPPFLVWFELQRKDGKPVWTKYVIDSDSGVGTQIEVTDINGDGLPDIAISNKKGVYYFEQAAAPK